MTELPPNRFKRDLGRRQMLGIFATLASPTLTEMLAEVGFDWIIIDTEHSPNEAGDVVAQLQAMAATSTSAIVRPAWSDMVLVKRLLDFGAQTLLFPYVQSVAEAERAVSYTRYPTRGVRGVSGGSRGSRYGLATDYFARVEAEICVIVQIETAEALADIEAIASVDGVDAVFIGPADLAASMGHLGDMQHPDVQAAIDDGFRRLRAIGKPAGYLTTSEAEARQRIADGVAMVGIGTDAMIVARGSRALLQAVRPG